jgi:hypothetical protein
MISWLMGSRLVQGALAAALIGAAVLGWGAWREHQGRVAERQAAERAALEAYRTTTERMDAAVDDASRVPADRWLRDYLDRQRRGDD